MIICSQSFLICGSTHDIVMVTTCTCTMIYGSKVKATNLSSTGKNLLTKSSIFEWKIVIICLSFNVSFIDDQRLDVGDGKEINLEKCSRQHLNRQCIKYLAPVSHVIRLIFRGLIFFVSNRTKGNNIDISYNNNIDIQGYLTRHVFF